MMPPNKLLGPCPIAGGAGCDPPPCGGRPLTPICEGGPPRASISWRRRAMSSSYLVRIFSNYNATLAFSATAYLCLICT